MAKSKNDLIKEGKELGLNLKNSMSVYEMTHRIEEKKLEIQKEKENTTENKSEKKKATKIKGEY